MKNGTSVLELTMPTRTLCASAPPASALTNAAKHAASMKCSEMRIAVLLSFFINRHSCMRHICCKAGPPETFFHADARRSGRIEHGGSHDRRSACDTRGHCQRHHPDQGHPAFHHRS